MKAGNRPPGQSLRSIPAHCGAQGRPAIIAHGGAWDIPEDLHQVTIEGCREAAIIGWDRLTNGGTALDAVEAAVRVLEAAPVFDAGRGSVLNARGEIELDAVIMDGRDLNLGAVMAVKNICHPVTLARLVMTASEHTILAAEGAEIFAREHGISLCPSWELVVEREAERWCSSQSRDRQAEGPLKNASGHTYSGDTVGAVALDVHGHLAAATSTGGTFNKHPGRVGDSPLVGCGAYADDRTGAVSATGDGEQLMRIVISKSAIDFLERGMTAQEAADAAVALLTQRTDGQGGVVVLGRHGDFGVAHCTPQLVHAHVTPEGEAVAHVHA